MKKPFKGTPANSMSGIKKRRKEVNKAVKSTSGRRLIESGPAGKRQKRIEMLMKELKRLKGQK